MIFVLDWSRMRGGGRRVYEWSARYVEFGRKLDSREAMRIGLNG